MASKIGLSILNLVVKSCLVLFAGGIIRFLIKLYRTRRRFQLMQKQGLPMAPHHPVWGHLQVVGGIMSKLPKDAHSQVFPLLIGRAMPDLGPAFYIDTWPLGYPMLVITDPDQAYQITQVHSLPKFHAMRRYLKPLTGGNDLVSIDGKEWKTWRNIFNPGFGSAHLMTLVPDILKDVSVFCKILRGLAEKSSIVQMDPLATKLTFDVIIRVALDYPLNAQQGDNDFLDAFRSQTRWASFDHEPNLFDRYHPFRPIVHWWNDRRITQYVSDQLNLRFRHNRERNPTGKKGRSKTIIDLALDGYLAEQPPNAKTDVMDATFQSFAAAQIRTFILAGHDTTGSTICYAYHLLSLNPSARLSLIEEHNSILGLKLDQAASQLCENPHLLNQLPYTTAVIREALRLYPPASTTRSGEPGYFLKGHDGSDLPTDGFMVWSNAYAMHHSPGYWPEPEKFLPERWLVEEGHYLYPRKGAYRPFEFGPRNCIGQELAMLELKIVLVMTAREFKIESAYDEWDSLHPGKQPKTVNGDRAYQIILGAAHPNDGLPCRVRLAAS